MKIVITESQLNYIISESTEMVESGSHQAKELKRLLEWSVKFLKCTITPTKNGIKICPPSKIEGRCRPTHLSDKALFDVERDLAKWFGVTRQDIHLAYKSWRPLRKNDESVNESIYSKRRITRLEKFLDDALSYIDPSDFGDGFDDYLSEVATAVADDILTNDENIEYNSEEYVNMLDEVGNFVENHFSEKIKQHFYSER